METILAPFSASISELKKNPGALIQKADGNPVTILNRNKPTAYLVPAATYEALLEKLEDHELGQIILERKAQRDQAVEVSINDL
ncbi:type II toxin-antitoxin system Phd/YefM family antitoxin [Desulfobotulus sp. H1]|uniref:Antitoxin n=1 Tax=Desulfobotulus pelophilus TaxID=2823377 RepID=A0ABT3NDE9_9BACT|nr:type II toxin-antitoxin system Phd/YefM family antitoxin [Desulfobotulus pelophilus]MCW7755486.1 type II toxin-antitoxin system Phd/YefM family antitoxin [Desulfobotulus pelophilus]